ncbi:MAG TPA: hypothetical protein VNZ52_14150 [Candidatus Thermoplasmatota archaeon]|nr:hypothetical protein [Candidatus Thermoplasmatota archaeon]
MAALPLLKKQSQLVRNLAFVPVAALGSFIGFAIGEVSTESFGIALPVGLLLGIAVAYLVCGTPKAKIPQVKLPKVSPKAKPYLWFPITAVLFGVLYFLIGLGLTAYTQIDLKLLAYISITASLLLAGTAAFLMVGFPNLIKAPKEAYEKIPKEKRPLLFYPLSALFVGILFIGLGVGLSASGLFQTRPGGPGLIPELYLPLVCLGLSIPMGGGLAYLLVGFPKPKRSLSDSIPRVKPKHKPLAFALTFLLLGPLLSFPIGYGFSQVPAIPPLVLFPVALVLGYVLSFGLSVLTWGTPARWREEGVTVRLFATPRARLLLAPPVGIAVGGLVLFLFGAAGLELRFGILAGVPLGLLAGLAAGGVLQQYSQARGDHLVPAVPEKFKLLVFLGTWATVAFLLFYGLGFLGLNPPWNTMVALAVGLVVGFLVTEESLFRQWREERRARSERKAYLKQLRAERLGLAKPKKAAAAPAEPASTPVEVKKASEQKEKRRFSLPFGRGKA